MTAVAVIDADIAEQVARRLVSEGYSVMREPAPHLLPRELRDFRPDILATRPGESLIVEITRPRRGEPSAGIDSLAEKVRALPGWRLELVVGGETSSPEPWSIEETRERLDHGESLLRAGHGEAALMILWAVWEATARVLAEAEGVTVQRWAPAALMSQLVHHGLLGQEDLDTVREVSFARNEIAHGMKASLDAGAAAARLAAVIRRMLVELDHPTTD